MNKRAWHFLINTFFVVTRRSYKKALTLATKHLAALAANNFDPVIAAIEASFTAVLQAYTAAEQNLNAALGTYFGKTQTVEELFEELNTDKLSYWEGQLHYFYQKGSTKANELMRNRSAFQQGTYEQRILAIKTFGDSCAAIADLVPLSVNVLAFHTQIASARALQLTDGEGRVDLLRSLRQTAHEMLCHEMYGNLGLLMHHYRKAPLQVERYFDLTLLRSRDDEDTDVEVVIYAENALSGTEIAGATAVLTRASGEQLTRQTDEKGKVRFLIDNLTEPEDVSITITAAGFEPFIETGTIEPGEDMDGTVQLMPIPPTPPTPPAPPTP